MRFRLRASSILGGSRSRDSLVYGLGVSGQGQDMGFSQQGVVGGLKLGEPVSGYSNSPTPPARKGLVFRGAGCRAYRVAGLVFC